MLAATGLLAYERLALLAYERPAPRAPARQCLFLPRALARPRSFL